MCRVEVCVARGDGETGEKSFLQGAPFRHASNGPFRWAPRGEAQERPSASETTSPASTGGGACTSPIR